MTAARLLLVLGLLLAVPGLTRAQVSDMDLARNIAEQGRGNHPDGSFSYFARVQVVGGAGRLLSGNVLFVPSSPDITCSGGSLTPP